LLLPGAGVEKAMLIAERLRRTVESLSFTNTESPWGFVTVSVGVASLVPEKNETAEKLVEAADAGLYAAKHRGRNTVVAHEPVACRKPADALSPGGRRHCRRFCWLPLLHGLTAGLVQMHMGADTLDPCAGNEMMPAARLRVRLGKLDALTAFQLVDDADMLAVRADHFHVLLDLPAASHGRLPSMRRSNRPGAGKFLRPVDPLRAFVLLRSGPVPD
jgi:hypothetical protein